MGKKVVTRPDWLTRTHCDTPQCVNPDHLFVGTRKDNVDDMMSKGRRIYPTGYGKRWTSIRRIKNPNSRSVCKHGHILNDETIYVNLLGHVSCRLCRNISMKRRRDGMSVTATKP